MEQDPLQSGKRILRDATIPHGGTLLLILLPVVLLVGTVGIGWLVYWLPHTTLSDSTTLIVIIALMVESALVALLLFMVFPGYLKFVSVANSAVSTTAVKGERYVHALTGSTLGFWEYDVAKGEVYMSGSMMAMLGYPDRDKTDRIDFWWESTHDEDIEGLKRTIEYNFDKL